MMCLSFLFRRDFAAYFSVILFGFSGMCLGANVELIENEDGSKSFTTGLHSTLEDRKDVRCGYHAIQMVARLLNVDRGIQEVTPSEAPALSVIECIDKLEKLGLHVEPIKLEGNILVLPGSQWVVGTENSHHLGSRTAFSMNLAAQVMRSPPPRWGLPTVNPDGPISLGRNRLQSAQSSGRWAVAGASNRFVASVHDF